jgi:predicted dithiol-disulfide oxidoreductase (DUF899 family)
MAATQIGQITEVCKQIAALKQRLTELRQNAVNEPIEDHVLINLEGVSVRLSELFCEKCDLLVVHNMGRGCPYCTLWADGFIGIYPHMASRTSFVLCSGDSWEVAKEFSESRRWNFPVVSGKESGFAKAMGYQGEDGGWLPGVSAFHKNEDGTIIRTAQAEFGPGDDFCSVWSFFDLLRDGKKGWEPKFDY